MRDMSVRPSDLRARTHQAGQRLVAFVRPNSKFQLQVNMATNGLHDFLSHVDDDMGVRRDEPFIKKALDILQANMVSLPFELVGFDFEACEEGPQACLPGSLAQCTQQRVVCEAQRRRGEC